MLFERNNNLDVYFQGKEYMKLYLQCDCANRVKTDRTKIFALHSIFSIVNFSNHQDSLKFNSPEFVNYLKSINKYRVSSKK